MARDRRFPRIPDRLAPAGRLTDDPVLARVAAARPPVPEADLAPTGERAAAIRERVMDTPRTDGPDRAGRATWWSRRRPRRPAAFGALGGLALAAVAAALVLVLAGGGAGHGRAPVARPLPTVGPHPVPASAAFALDSHATLAPSSRRLLDRTPLGRAIAQQYLLIQEDIGATGDAAQNRRVLQQLQFNQAACLHAAAVVGAAPLRPGQGYLQYDWVTGIRLQARLDELYSTGIRETAAGHPVAGQRAFNAAGNLSNISDLYTAYPMNRLQGSEPLPHVPGIEGPNGKRRPGRP